VASSLTSNEISSEGIDWEPLQDIVAVPSEGVKVIMPQCEITIPNDLSFTESTWNCSVRMPKNKEAQRLWRVMLKREAQAMS
jgi:hypothetical protein